MAHVKPESDGLISVRRAVPVDSRDIWLWRNDAFTRAMSISPDDVPWESHAEWFRTSLHDRNRYLYVGCLNADSRRIGMCRFDVDPGKKALADVSINLNPAMRGLSLSHRLLSAAVRLFLTERRADLAATVKKQNAASIRCFTRCGFILDGEDAGYAYYRLPAHLGAPER